MKNLILIPILFLSYILQAQYIVVKPSQLPAASTINPTDLFILNQGTTTKKVTYSILNTVLKDTFATKNALRDTAAAIRASSGGSGSTIYASDGVYMDGDTVKLKYTTDHDSSLIWNFKENSFIPNATDGNFYGGIELAKYYVQLATVRRHYPNLPFAQVTVVNDDNKIVNITQSTRGYEGNIITLQIDTTGAHYLEGNEPDTTLTTPLHLMTEAQTKREIAAADDWKATSAGIRYEGDTGDSVAIARDGTIKIYKSGNLKTSINPRVASTGNAVAYLFDTHNSLAVGDKIFSIRNIGSEKLSIDYAGLLNTNSYLAGVAGTGTNITSNSLYINTSYTNRLRLDPFVTDAANAIAYLFDTNNNLITNGAKIFSIRNQGIEKVSIDKDGILTFKGTYASIYRHKSLGDTTQSIPNGTTPTKVLAFSTNGEQSNCTADKTNDKITITKPGRYMVNLSLSYASGTNAVNWTAYIFNGGVECENIHSTGYTSTANDKRSTSLSGIINVTSVPCDIDYRVTHSAGASVDLIMTYVNLSLTYIGD